MIPTNAGDPAARRIEPAKGNSLGFVISPDGAPLRIPDTSLCSAMLVDHDGFPVPAEIRLEEIAGGANDFGRLRTLVRTNEQPGSEFLFRRLGRCSDKNAATN